MANFNYTHKDFDVCFRNVIGEKTLDINDFGLNSTCYDVLEKIEYDIVENNINMNEDIIKTYGFQNIDTFKEMFCRAHLWNNYIYSEHDKSLRDFLTHYYTKAKHFHPNANIPSPKENGNILEYLKSFKIVWLISIGW